MTNPSTSSILQSTIKNTMKKRKAPAVD